MEVSVEHCLVGERQHVCRLFRLPGLSGPQPGILIFPDLWGIGEQVCDWATRFAAQGYVAMAVDPFGDGRPARDLQHGLSMMDEVVRNVSLWRASARRMLDHLAAHDGVDEKCIGAIGFCFGGSTVLELARSGALLAAGICVHGDVGRSSAEDAAAICARLLVCNGAEDPVVPVEQCCRFASDLRGTKIDWRYVLLGGVGHSFTNPDAARAGVPGVAYDAAAALQVWDYALAFFNETFGSHGPRHERCSGSLPPGGSPIMSLGEHRITDKPIIHKTQNQEPDA